MVDRGKDYREEDEEEVWGFIRNDRDEYPLTERTQKLLKLTKEKFAEQKRSPRKFGLPPIVVTDKEMGEEKEEAKEQELPLPATVVKKKKEKKIDRSERLHWKQ